MHSPFVAECVHTLMLVLQQLEAGSEVWMRVAEMRGRLLRLQHGAEQYVTDPVSVICVL